MELRYIHNWQVTGSKLHKKQFLSLLMRNGMKSFNGRTTVKYLLLEGSVIRGIDHNRKQVKGSYFIHSDSLDATMLHFDLDTMDVFWVLQFILTPKIS